MIRAAVCGLGIGMAHCAGYLASRNAELVAVCDLLPERLASVGGTFDSGSMLVLRGLFDEKVLSRSWKEIGVRTFEGLEALLDYGEFDVVSLCTPDYLHADQAQRILRAGKHLMLEKPVALTRRDALEVTDAAARAEAKGIRTAVGYEFRVNPAIAKIRELVEEGRIGSVEAVSIHHFRTPFKRDKWRRWIQRKEHSGGLIVEETSHWFDLVRYISSREIVDLRCVTSDRIHSDFDFEDVAFIDGRLGGGGVFQIEHSLAGFDFSFTVSVYGTRGTARCGLKENPRSSLDGGQSDYIGVVAWGDSNLPSDEARTALFGPEAGEPETIELNVMRFVDAVDGGAPLDCTARDGLLSLEASLLAGVSAVQNTVVRTEEVDSIE